MSDYDKRYNLCVGFVSVYADTPEEVLAKIEHYEAAGFELKFICEGYADYRDMPGSRTMVTRRTTGSVLLSTIEFLVERNKVQKLRAALS